MKAWIARDKNGTLAIYLKYKPKKFGEEWVNYCQMCSYLQEDDVREIGVNPQWSDKKPVEVELKIEKI